MIPFIFLDAIGLRYDRSKQEACEEQLNDGISKSLTGAGDRFGGAKIRKDRRKKEKLEEGVDDSQDSATQKEKENPPDRSSKHSKKKEKKKEKKNKRERKK